MTRAALALPPDLDERTLVRELTHRVNNQLASAIDVVTAAAVRAEHPEAKVALGNIADLLQEQANVHRVLTIPEGDTLVDAAQYLRQLCLATTRSRLEPIGVHLSFRADTLPLEAERCWRLGMAVYELLLTLSASILLGTAVIMPNAALAQLPGPPLMGPGGPPLGGPPPGLGVGGPPLGGPPRGLEAGPAHGGPDAPPRFSRLDGTPAGRGIDHTVQSNLHGFEGRASAFSSTTKNDVNNSYANHGYGHVGWRHGYRGRYGDSDGDSYAQADGCYYAYRRYNYRRTLVCSSD